MLFIERKNQELISETTTINISVNDVCFLPKHTQTHTHCCFQLFGNLLYTYIDSVLLFAPVTLYFGETNSLLSPGCMSYFSVSGCYIDGICRTPAVVCS